MAAPMPGGPADVGAELKVGARERTDEMSGELTEDDEGKRVVDLDGNQIGTVDDVDYSAVHVLADPDAELGNHARELDERDGGEIYEIQDKHVTDVTDDEIRVDLGA